MIKFIKSLFSKKEDHSSSSYKIGNCNVSTYVGWSGKLDYRFDLYDEDGNDIGFIMAALHEKFIGGKTVKVLYIDRSFVNSSFRGKGYGKMLYSYLAKAWHLDPRLKGSVIERYFISEIAYNIARWLVDSKQLPEYTWDDRFITCAFEEVAS